VIPESGKIVIIDTRISIKNAFFALMENGTSSFSSRHQDAHVNIASAASSCGSL
jgi:hypothetical protein